MPYYEISWQGCSWWVCELSHVAVARAWHMTCTFFVISFEPKSCISFVLMWWTNHSPWVTQTDVNMYRELGSTLACKHTMRSLPVTDVGPWAPHCWHTSRAQVSILEHSKVSFTPQWLKGEQCTLSSNSGGHNNSHHWGLTKFSTMWGKSCKKKTPLNWSNRHHLGYKWSNDLILEARASQHIRLPNSEAPTPSSKIQAQGSSFPKSLILIGTFVRQE